MRAFDLRSASHRRFRWSPPLRSTPRPAGGAPADGVEASRRERRARADFPAVF
jgi:hypothetical protein